MKVLLLSDTYSEHTEKWALGLAGKGIQVGLFSFNKASYDWYHKPNITVFFEPDREINAESTLTKLSYLKYVSVLKKIIRQFKPDILHAHYATSYGLVGALTGFRPFVLSVWGSDVYDFPRRSKLHRKIFQYNLRKAGKLLSTSKVMREELKKYTAKEVFVTPFGVDTALFSPSDERFGGKKVIRLGTIKPIEEKYGIEYIIEAAAILKETDTVHSYFFHLVGPCSDPERYSSMIKMKGLQDSVILEGRIPFSQISDWHRKLDIFLNVSVDDSESFGVATVEAMSCAKPVVVTDVGGLMEVVDNGKFGIVVPKMNSKAIADAVKELTADPEKAKALGIQARMHVLENYDWEKNLELMIEQYRSMLK